MSFESYIKTALFVALLILVSACGKHYLPGDVIDEAPPVAAVDDGGLPTTFYVINTYQGAGAD